MPSIFTRSRNASTHSKKNKNKTHPDYPTTVIDEFGRVTSRSSVATASKETKKEKKDKDKGWDKRQRTQSSPQDTIDLQSLPDGSFMPFSWGRVEDSDEPRAKLKEYGYMSYRSEVVLGIEEASRLVGVIAAELNERGLTTPLLFSNLALDISRTRIHRLIDGFLATCPSYNCHSGSPIDLKWQEEAKFAGPHELGMTLRWGLARIVRIYGGQETRGIIAWDTYLRWREDEAAKQYPPDHFAAFLPFLPIPIQRLLVSLLSLLSRLTTHATTSGLIPPTLASLFGPLLFGLGSTTLPFHHTYGAYLRCSHAAEHLLLSYVRSQPPPLPSRLADWIRGYPAMLPPPDKLDKARAGAKIVRLNTVKRNVRLYSIDLVRTAAGWDIGTTCREWNRVVGPPGMKLTIKYSDAYRKRMDLPPNSGPDAASTAPSNTESITAPQDEQRFRSLTDLKWGEFESLGFGAGEAASKRLEFDLNEGARNARASPARNLSWTDFSESGFSLTDAPLSATLQFSAPLTHTITAWPARQNELQAKLRKTQKALPPFGWDTTPTLGVEEAVEEGFVSIFCDFLAGGGWVDRAEGTFRECNWAMVEYKSTPQTRPHPPAPLPPDPRTSNSVWLYEEFVPPEYQAQLTAPRRKMPLALPFSRSHHNANLKVTRVPNARELEFEGLLGGGMGNVTKVISLGGGTTTVVGGRPISGKDSLGISGPMYVGHPPGAPFGLAMPKPELTSALPPPPPIKVQPPPPPLVPSLPVSSAPLPPLPSPSPSPSLTPTPNTPTPSTTWARFRPGGTIRKRSSPAGVEYDASIDFETRTMFAGDDTEGEGEDEDEGGPEADVAGGTKKMTEIMLKKRLRRQGHVRRESKDDAWVDILVKEKPQSTGVDQDRDSVVPSVGSLRKRRSLGDMGIGEAERVREEIRGVLDVQPLDNDDVEEARSSYSAVDETLETEYSGGLDDEEADSEALEGLPLAAHNHGHSQHARKESGLLPVGLMLNHLHTKTSSPSAGSLAIPHPQAPETPPKPQIPVLKSGTKNVSSLIEMYREKDRERERERERDMGVAPSKLPVRASPSSSSIGAEPSTLSPPKGEPHSLPPSSPFQSHLTPATTASQIPITVSIPAQQEVRPISPEPPSIPDEDIAADDLGVMSPLNPATPRYVHGAPLHNVVEEEGEDEVDI